MDELEQIYMAALLSNPAVVTKCHDGEAAAHIMLRVSEMAAMAASIYEEPEEPDPEVSGKVEE